MNCAGDIGQRVEAVRCLVREAGVAWSSGEPESIAETPERLRLAVDSLDRVAQLLQTASPIVRRDSQGQLHALSVEVRHLSQLVEGAAAFHRAMETRLGDKGSSYGLGGAATSAHQTDCTHYVEV